MSKQILFFGVAALAVAALILAIRSNNMARRNSADLDVLTEPRRKSHAKEPHPYRAPEVKEELNREAHGNA